jgi:hypothetical protein
LFWYAGYFYIVKQNKKYKPYNFKLMKFKLFIATAAALTMGIGAFAKAPETANAKAQKHLSIEFKDAEKISWSTKANLLEASFEWSGQKLHTFYNEEGEQVALSREISMDRLPIKALQTIKEKYSDYKAGEAIELSSAQDGLSYYLSLENGDKKVILSITTEGSVSVFK